MNPVTSYLWHMLRDDPRQWRPMLSVFYLTYACDFRCAHCADGTGTPYHALCSRVLSADRVMELFGIIRRHCQYLVITGGEPLQHPEIDRVLSRIPELGFRGVTLTTNGHDLDRVLPAVARSVTDLVISLQTMDSAKADLAYGRTGAHQHILGNLQAAAEYPRRGYRIIVSGVATPGNLKDLYEVSRYAKQRGFQLAVCPQLVGVKAHSALTHNQDYRDLCDYLITEKRRGVPIYGTVDYLEHLRDLRKFRCRPFTMLVVSPAGDVFYPCLELGKFAGNLFAEPDLHRLRQAGFAQFGPQPQCGTQCHSACALGFARILDNPLSLLQEAYLTAKSSLVSRLVRTSPARPPAASFENSPRR